MEICPSSWSHVLCELVNVAKRRRTMRKLWSDGLSILGRSLSRQVFEETGLLDVGHMPAAGANLRAKARERGHRWLQSCSIGCSDCKLQKRVMALCLFLQKFPRLIAFKSTWLNSITVVCCVGRFISRLANHESTMRLWCFVRGSLIPQTFCKLEPQLAKRCGVDTRLCWGSAEVWWRSPGRLVAAFIVWSWHLWDCRGWLERVRRHLHAVT